MGNMRLCRERHSEYLHMYVGIASVPGLTHPDMSRQVSLTMLYEDLRNELFIIFKLPRSLVGLIPLCNI